MEMKNFKLYLRLYIIHLKQYKILELNFILDKLDG